MPEATKLFGVFGFLCVQDDGRTQTMGWCLFFKPNHQTSGVLVFKYLVLHWKAGTSHMLLERETAIQESGGNSKSSFGSQLSIPTTQTEVYLQHTCLGPTIFLWFWFSLWNYLFFMVMGKCRDQKLTEQSTESCDVLSTLAAVAFGAGSCQSSFSLHSLAKAQQFCYVQTIICKDSCFCFPQMMYLYKKAERNWPSHWEMLVLIPNPMWASGRQYSKEVQEEERSHLWSAFLMASLSSFPLKSRGEITRM